MTCSKTFQEGLFQWEELYISLLLPTIVALLFTATFCTLMRELSPIELHEVCGKEVVRMVGTAEDTSLCPRRCHFGVSHYRVATTHSLCSECEVSAHPVFRPK